MPSPHLPPPAVRRALRKLGGDIRDARLSRRLPMELIAERASTSRPTVSRIEKGDHNVSIGIYASVLHALGLLDGLSDLADLSRDAIGLARSLEALPKRARLSKNKKTGKNG